MSARPLDMGYYEFGNLSIVPRSHNDEEWTIDIRCSLNSGEVTISDVYELETLCDLLIRARHWFRELTPDEMETRR